MVGGTDGGLDGPADRLYPDLAQDLLPHGIATLRLDFRQHIAPGIVEEGVQDVLCGASYLKENGAREIALVGHSFGAAVVITAGAVNEEVKAVACLSAQSAGTGLVHKLTPRPLLLVHGQEDRRLPPACSEYIFARAGEPKQLILLPKGRHSLRQCREEVRQILVQWLTQHMAQGGEGTAGP